jgi:hypothetical protein
VVEALVLSSLAVAAPKKRPKNTRNLKQKAWITGCFQAFFKPEKWFLRGPKSAFKSL